MILPDVNVLVYAHRQDVEDHACDRSWLEGAVGSDAAFGLADIVLSGFLRVVTNPRAFSYPTPIHEAFRFAEALRSSPNYVPINPGPRHWPIDRKSTRLNSSHM